jgi:hypothetical protein
LKGGCDLFDSDVVFGHYKSLEARDLELALLLQLNFLKGLGDLGNDINVTFIGDEVLQQQYDISISGVPAGTVLNPIQRDYLQGVTLDFLDAFSKSVPNRVTIGQSTDKRRQLRSRWTIEGNGDSRPHWRRSLEAGNVVKAGALIYGIGKDSDAFFKEIEKAFASNAKQYKDDVQQQQYLPGEINDEENFGAIFENITDVSVARSQASEPTLPPAADTSSKDKLSSSQIQIIIFSILIAITFFWLVYRIMKDCVLVQDGWAVKKEKLSDKVERDKASAVNRPELSNMDKPRQRTSVVIDIGSLPEIKVPTDDSSVPSKASSDRPRRRAPASRGVHAAKSTDDLDMLRPRSNLSANVSREPTRGVRRAKSSDVDLLFESQSVASARSNRSRAEPVRGVGRSKSSDNANFLRRPLVNSTDTTPSANKPGKTSTTPTVARSRSNDLMEMVDAPKLASPTGKPKSASKPSSGKKKTKKTKKNSTKSLGDEANKGSSNHEKKEGKKRKSVKKKSAGTGEKSATAPASPKKRSEKPKSQETSVADGTVPKKKKKTKATEGEVVKKSKKASKSPKTKAASGEA